MWSASVFELAGKRAWIDRELRAEQMLLSRGYVDGVGGALGIWLLEEGSSPV